MGVEFARPIPRPTAPPGKTPGVAILSIGAAMTAKLRLSVFAFVVLALFPVLAGAATSEFRVLLDVDNNTATGCVVGGMSGVDQILVTHLETTEGTAEVT